MGVSSMSYDTAAVEAALFRSTGVKYGGMVFGPAISPAKRTVTATGKGVGHVYMHDADADPMTGRCAPLSKSAFENHTVMVAAIVDALASAKGKSALKWLDDNPASTDGLWLHGATGIAVVGDWYGYPQGTEDMRKIARVALNMRAHGDALFITSAYPDAFH